MSIKILPSSVADQIAAGEVVERPASVVKECVENSLDAGATNIVIKIQNGGTQLIEITDNGKGMSPDDAEKCILRHATSKIETIDDVFAIQTFGFRGEALAAISAVSDFELITKTESEEVGTRIEIYAGKDMKISSVGANRGTTLRIKNLFSPTPVRLAHLKNSSTESRHIAREIQNFALSNPTVSFRFFREDKQILDYPSATSRIRSTQIIRLADKDLVEINTNILGIDISGFISNPSEGVQNKKEQFLFVNGRAIQDYRLAFAIREAYVQSVGIEHHLHPKFALFITLDPLLVDVNVHPRKTEVRFSDPRDVFHAVKQAAMSALQKFSSQKFNSYSSTSIPSFQSHFERNKNVNTSFKNTSTEAPFPSFSFQHKTRNNENLNKSLFVSLQANGSVETMSTPTQFKLISQIQNKYILAETEDGMYFFDQHALHERQRFEEFWNKKDQLLNEKQTLLIPQKINLSLDQRDLLWENKSVMKTLGFEIQFLEDNTLEISQIPSLLEGESLDAMFAAFAEFFEQDSIGEHFSDKFLRKILEYKSCRGAVMFGDPLSREEMQKLLDDFANCDFPDLCPHGRPNHVFWKWDELDGMFHR